MTHICVYIHGSTCVHTQHTEKIIYIDPATSMHIYIYIYLTLKLWYTHASACRHTCKQRRAHLSVGWPWLMGLELLEVTDNSCAASAVLSVGQGGLYTLFGGTFGIFPHCCLNIKHLPWQRQVARRIGCEELVGWVLLPLPGCPSHGPGRWALSKPRLVQAGS